MKRAGSADGTDTARAAQLVRISLRSRVSMAHSLSPNAGGGFLPQAEVVVRLIRAFPIHEIDQKKGAIVADQMIAQLERMNAPSGVIDSYRSRKGRAISVYVSDDGSENRFLYFTLWPEERIFISYHSEQHESESRPLLERLAQMLDYQVALV